jgi:predicted permease
MPLMTVLKQKHAYPMSIFRLILVPIVGVLIMRALGVSETICNIFAATSGLPVGATAVIYSHTYKNGAEATASGMLVTTVLSAITVPIVMMLLNIQI